MKRYNGMLNKRQRRRARRKARIEHVRQRLNEANGAEHDAAFYAEGLMTAYVISDKVVNAIADAALRLHQGEEQAPTPTRFFV